MTKNLVTLSEDQFYLLNEITEEFKKGMLALNSLPSHRVTFYGGAKIEFSSDTYEKTKQVAAEFAKRDWGVVSGGGPGIMAASLEGAKSVGGKTVAFRINLDNEPPTVKDADMDILFQHFSARKYVLRQSDVFVYAPGGLGTLDELMENLTLIKTKKYPAKPIFLFDSSFWHGYVDWFNDVLLKERKTVGEDFKDLFEIVDTSEEIMKSLFG